MKTREDKTKTRQEWTKLLSEREQDHSDNVRTKQQFSRYQTPKRILVVTKAIQVTKKKNTTIADETIAGTQTASV